MLNTKNKILRPSGRKLCLFAILTILVTFGVNQGSVVKTTPAKPEVTKVEAKQLDPRAKVLANYFASKNSPFEYQAQDFVDAADKYGLDWKLVPAISGVESTFGKAAYGYNAWGWGIYGDQALGFNSWKDGIETVSAGLKTGYIDKGLTNPYSINKVYAASPTWGSRVNFFLNDIDKFANANSEIDARGVNPLTKTAGASARLALK